MIFEKSPLAEITRTLQDKSLLLQVNITSIDEAIGIGDALSLSSSVFVLQQLIRGSRILMLANELLFLGQSSNNFIMVSDKSLLLQVNITSINEAIGIGDALSLSSLCVCDRAFLVGKPPKDLREETRVLVAILSD
ncbi:hypothetical protein Tco_0363607 [Tanacetum coccineum]